MRFGEAENKKIILVSKVEKKPVLWAIELSAQGNKRSRKPNKILLNKLVDGSNNVGIISQGSKLFVFYRTYSKRIIEINFNIT